MSHCFSYFKKRLQMHGDLLRQLMLPQVAECNSHGSTVVPTLDCQSSRSDRVLCL